ncbi:unnamed protein product [Rotaria sordida]|uniref:Uncharacterized protein n=1 Tax=Rotaria sordida TaxID=392033 RepID=A0A814HRX8_9BILA|nr:unnamed protein product [Rotaria sordida]
MIGVLVNPNSVYVPCVQSGCCKIEFDLTYPIHLNGIISKDEFRESINKIYKTFSSYKNIIIAYSIIFALGIVFGMATCIVAITMPSKYSTVFPLVIDIGRSTDVTNVISRSDQVVSNLTSFYERQNNSASSPYPAKIASFCSYCNAPRQDSLPEFCLSWEYSFNIF